MIWRSVICFSLACVCSGAIVRGQIHVVEPKHDTTPRPDRSGTVIWLEPLSDIPAEPRYEGRLEMIQKNKTFQPHVLAVSVGSRVDFPNFDPIFHNAFSNYNGEIFDIGLYPPGSTRSVRFRREGIVRVFCNIHSSMSAVIVVLRTPYYTVSSKDGTFQLSPVPPGKYRLQLYHEKATEQNLAALSKVLEVENNAKDVGNITITEDAYLPIPHLNKYGRPYGPANESSTYPGARQ